jgi:hypothetical protein
LRVIGENSLSNDPVASLIVVNEISNEYLIAPGVCALDTLNGGQALLESQDNILEDRFAFLGRHEKIH